MRRDSSEWGVSTRGQSVEKVVTERQWKICTAELSFDVQRRGVRICQFRRSDVQTWPSWPKNLCMSFLLLRGPPQQLASNARPAPSGADAISTQDIASLTPNSKPIQIYSNHRILVSPPSAQHCFHFGLLTKAWSLCDVQQVCFIVWQFNLSSTFSFLPAIPLLLWWRGWCWRLRPPQWFGRLTLNARSTRSDTPGNGSSPRQSNHWMGTGVI